MLWEQWRLMVCRCRASSDELDVDLGAGACRLLSHRFPAACTLASTFDAVSSLRGREDEEGKGGCGSLFA